MASITVLGSGPDKQYRVNYELPRINGVRKRGSKTFPKGTPKKFVDEFKRQQEIKLATGEFSTNCQILLTDYIETVYFPTYTKFLSPTTVSNYWRLYKSKKPYCVKTYFEGKKLKTITRREIQEYINELSDHVSPKTVRAYVMWLHTVYDTAITEEIIKPTCNPVSHNRLPPKIKPDIEAFTIEEVNRLLELSKDDPITHLVIGLGTLAGLRRGEMMGLKWSDVNLTEGEEEIRIARTVVIADGKKYVKEPKTKAGKRPIPIPTTLAKILRDEKFRYMQNKLKYGPDFKGEGFVICKENGEPFSPDGVSIRYERFMYMMNDEYKIPYKSLHKLRHTYATLLINGGANVKVVQRALGHEDVMMTLGTYAHAYETRERHDVDKLENMLMKNTCNA